MYEKEVDFVTSEMLEEDIFQGPLFDQFNNDDSGFEGGRCGICMDIIIDRGVLDCCQHWFCFACIDNWSTITNLCPLCQGEFQLITCVPVYDTTGSNNIDEDSISRDDDWCIEGKGNTLSFPSYYIDENVIILILLSFEFLGQITEPVSETSEFHSNLQQLSAWMGMAAKFEVDPQLSRQAQILIHQLLVILVIYGIMLFVWALIPKAHLKVHGCAQGRLEADDYSCWSVLGCSFLVQYSPAVSLGTANILFLCVVEVPQSSVENSIPRTNNHCSPKSANGECLAEAAFSRKVSVSVADAGETALVVSIIGGNQWTEEPNENFLSLIEADKGLTNEAFNFDKADSASSERTNMQSTLEAQKLDLSLSNDMFSLSNSLGPSELKTDCVDENSQSSFAGVSSRKTGNRLSESESSMGLHLGLSVGSFLSVDDTNKDVSEDQVMRDVQQHNPPGESSPKACKIEPGTIEEASQTIGVKRNHTDFSDNVHVSADGEETKGKKKTEVPAKKIRAEGKTQIHALKDKANVSTSDDSRKCPTLIAGANNDMSKLSPKKEDVTYDVMSIVKGTGRKSSKGLAHRNSADNISTERENASGLRVKKIMKRAAEDKDSSVMVQELRNEIREAVRNRTSTDVGDNLFDPKLLAAFRAAIAGPKAEPVKKLSPSAVKVKKSLLEKGKVRENLTKKIYGSSSGRRRHAWVRDCEVEFWKYRCMRATKPEKIETLKSVLNLLRKNSHSSDIEQATESQATNPILSRLYLADTSVFPRKDDIKPLSALKPTGNSEQGKEQTISMEKALKLSLDNCSPKVLETNKVSYKGGIPSVDEKETRNILSCSKGDAASSKVHLKGRLSGPSFSPLGSSTVNTQKGTTAKSDDVKMDKRKWALEILARKSGVAGKSTTREKQEDNAVLKGNYPLLAKLPVDMRPVLAPSCHNKIPISVRQFLCQENENLDQAIDFTVSSSNMPAQVTTGIEHYYLILQMQLYRLTECFLKKANLLVIRRTAETELAVADAVNIEEEVADRSNSKLVYLNLCSQEILHRSNNKKSIRTTESNSSPSAVPVDESEQVTDKISSDPTVEEALRKAGLLSDSPPNSPHHPTEVPNEVEVSSMETREEGPDNVFELDSHAEVDIYGDFEYDLEDEDYIGASAVKVPMLQPDEVSKMKVVFSTLNSENSNNIVDLEDGGGGEKNDVHKDAGIKISTEEGQTGKPCVPPESLPCEEDEDLSLAECEELYGPDKEPLLNKFPELSGNPHGLLDGEARSENKCHGEASNVGTESKAENISVSTVNHNSFPIEKSPNSSQTGDRIPRKNTASNTGPDKQSDGVNSVSKKVEAYIKEHIRPLCKSGVITAEQYRWAVAKTTDKVMKYHSNAKNANFLIKEGEKVKNLAEQYIEAAQQKEKSDLQR
ncbi:hypothetical protein JRO89_XS13G0132300 [Xanthoceras sorbifolium]|uniref:RING-type domain-containing protein n=1 Tax=Xanthoceras sorbifolium TaxID=99658 RepID=A0ABQ8H866_9ROSI|nr:hypothetical protein JRO89_XS13G0132300 [Xanthoceras sorbifolium]